MLDLLLLFWFVIVGGRAVLIRNAHVHVAGVFAGAAAIRGNTSCPAFAGAGGGAVGVLEGLVFLVWI